MDEGVAMRSIFAHELALILASRGTNIESLRRAPFTFDAKKVERLAGSLKSVHQLPALNHGELMSLVLFMKLTRQERVRLYAALVALGTQRLLLEYLLPQRAWEIACEVRDAAYAWLLEHRSEEDPLRRRTVQGGHGPTAEVQALDSEGEILEAALALYDEGIATGALGLFYGESDLGRQALRRASFCLEQAMTLLKGHAPGTSCSEVWAYWSNETQQALEQMKVELN